MADWIANDLSDASFDQWYVGDVELLQLVGGLEGLELLLDGRCFGKVQEPRGVVVETVEEAVFVFARPVSALTLDEVQSRIRLFTRAFGEKLLKEGALRAEGGREAVGLSDVSEVLVLQDGHFSFSGRDLGLFFFFGKITEILLDNRRSSLCDFSGLIISFGGVGAMKNILKKPLTYRNRCGGIKFFLFYFF